MKLDGKVQNASKTSLKFGGEETSLIVHINHYQVLLYLVSQKLIIACSFNLYTLLANIG